MATAIIASWTLWSGAEVCRRLSDLGKDEACGVALRYVTFDWTVLCRPFAPRSQRFETGPPRAAASTLGGTELRKVGGLIDAHARTVPTKA